MKDLGETSMILDMEIVRDRKREKLFLTQERYSKTVHKWCGIAMTRPTNTPTQSAICPKKRCEVGTKDFYNKSVPYCKAVGSLMYLIIEACSDTAFAVGKLSTFCKRPENKYLLTVKHALRYICGSKSQGISNGGENSIVPHG